MRLICPNCGAQYEIADDVIPEAGRDVQCSNCGHTWFENRGASALAEDAFADDAHGEPEPQDPIPSQPATSEPPSNADVPAYSEPDPETEPVRRELDVSVASILREEAEREEAARRNDMGGNIETQSEFGLNQSPIENQRAEESRRRIARIKGEEEGAVITAETAASSGSRRELLPDIEEINSSLRSSAERGEDPIDAPEIEERQRKRGFRFGFFVVLFVIALLALAYIFAPQIRAAVPQIDAQMQNYVDLVDQGRIWLDLKLQDLLRMVEGAEG